MFAEWLIMKRDFKVTELFSYHSSVVFKITGIGIQIPAHPLTCCKTT